MSLLDGYNEQQQGNQTPVSSTRKSLLDGYEPKVKSVQQVKQPVVKPQPVQQPIQQEYDVQQAINNLPMQHTVQPVQHQEQLNVQANIGTPNYDKNGKIYYTDSNGNIINQGNNLNPLQKLGNILKAKATNLDSYINRPSEEQRKQKEEQGKLLALMGSTTILPNPFNPVISGITKAIAKPFTGLIGGIANKTLQNAARGTLNNVLRAGAGATRGAIDSVPWSLGEAGIEKALGYESEETLPQKIAHNAKDFALFSGAAAPIIKNLKWAGKTKPAQETVDFIRNQADMHPMLADAIVGLKNFFTSDAKFQNKKDNLAKLERLNEIKNKHRDFTPEQLKQLEEAEKISIDDFGKMHKELTEGGNTLEAIKRELGAKSGDTQVNQEIEKLAYEFKQKPFNELTEQEQNEFYQYVEDKFNKQFEMERAAKKQSEAPESNLSHVEEQTNTNLPKEDLTHVKSDSGMANEIKQTSKENNIQDGYYEDEFGNTVKENKAKIQRFHKDEVAKQDKIGIKSKAEIKKELAEEYKNDVKQQSKPKIDTTNPVIKQKINKTVKEFEKNNPLPEDAVVAPKYQDQYRKSNTLNNIENKTNEFNNNVVDLSDRFGKNTHEVKRKPGRPSKNDGVIDLDDRGVFVKRLNKEEGMETLPKGNAEGSDTSWNTHGTKEKINSSNDYDLETSQNQYRKAYENNNGVEEANTVETAKSSRFIKDDPGFIKFYDEYIKASPTEKNAILKKKLAEIKKEEGVEGASRFYEDVMNQVDRDKLRYETGLSDKEVSDITESRNLAQAFKKNKIDIDTEKQEHIISNADKQKADEWLYSILPPKIREKLGSTDKTLDAMFDRYNTQQNLNKQYKNLHRQISLSGASDEVKRAMYEKLNEAAKKADMKKGIAIDTKSSVTSLAERRNEIIDKVKEAIKNEDSATLQKLLQDNKKIFDKPKDTITTKVKDDAYSKIAEISRKEMQEALDAGDFAKFNEIAKRTESIRKNDKTLYEVNEKKVWDDKPQHFEIEVEGSKYPNVEIAPVRGKVGTDEAWGKDFANVDAKYDAWKREQEYWENKVKEAKELPNQIQEHIDRTGVDYDTAKTIVKSNNKFVEKFKNKIQSIKNKFGKNLTKEEEYINIIQEHRNKATRIENEDGIDIIYSDKVGSSDLTEGQALPGYDTVLMRKSADKSIKKHEKQHVVDDKELKSFFKNDQNGEIYKQKWEDYRSNEYASAVETIKNLTDDVQNIRKNLKSVDDELFPKDVNGDIIYKNSDDFAETLSKLSDKNKLKDISIEDVNKLTNYNNARYTYTQDPLEINANKAMRGEQTGDIKNDVRKFLEEKYGTELAEQKTIDGVRGSANEGGNILNGYERETKGSKTGKPRLGIRQDYKGIHSAHYTPDGSYYSLNDTLKQSKSQFKTEGQKQTFKNLVKYSTEDEKTLIDLGIITEEQAKNRLKLQHHKGEGVYIPSTHNSPKGNIDIEHDYNIGRNTKKGVFGKKTKEDVKREVNAKEVTKQTIQRHININHVKNVSNYIEEAFAEPIINGEVKKGYIAVNKNILNTMMYGKYSKDWFKTVSAGHDAIDKAFKDEALNLGWKDLYNRSKKPDYQIPESVFNKLVDGTGEKAAEWWERYANNVKFGKAKGVGHWVGAINDALLNNFKKRVLTSSSFFLNNRIGNQIMLAMNSDNPIEYLKSFKGITKFKNDELPTEVIQNSLLEAVKDSTIRHRYTSNNAVDNALNLFNGSLIETKNLKGLKKAGANLANIVIGLPNKAFNKLSEKIMKFNQIVEDAERRQIFSQIVDKQRKELIKKTGQNMIKQEEVLKHINSDSEIHALVVKEIENALGDYKNFSPLEQKTLKRIVPFYSWYRTITRHTVKVSREHPERVALLALELKHLNDKGEEAKRKEYQRYAIPTGIKEKRTGKNLVVNKGHAIPYMTFKEFLDEGGKGSISSLIKTPLEAIRGKKFFLDQEISNNRYTKQGYKWNRKKHTFDKNAYFDNKTQDWLRDKEGNVKIDEDSVFGALPLSVRMKYIGKELLNDTVAPYLNNSLLNGEKVLTTAINSIKKGKLDIPDRMYDASFGGYKHGDIIGYKGKNKKPITRYVGNRLSPKAQAVNALLGLSLQNEAKLNKKELQELEKKKEQVRKRKAKFKKKAS